MKRNPTSENHYWGVAFVEEVHPLLHPEEVATIATQDHDGMGLWELA